MCEKFHNDRLRNDRTEKSDNNKKNNNNKNNVGSAWWPVSGSINYNWFITYRTIRTICVDYWSDCL